MCYIYVLGVVCVVCIECGYVCYVCSACLWMWVECVYVVVCTPVMCSAYVYGCALSVCVYICCMCRRRWREEEISVATAPEII